VNPSANAVEIPTDRIEQAFLEKARVGFTGSVTVHLSLSEDAAESVRFVVECNEKHRLGDPPSARDLGFPVPKVALDFDPREHAVYNGVAEKIRHRLKLGTPIRSVTGHFKDGMMLAIEVQEVQ